MKIIVLTGGLSSERDVSLSSGAGICKALRTNGHQAFLLDVFMGISYDSSRLEEIFSLPDAGISIANTIQTDEPDIATIKALRNDQSDCFFGENVIELCRMADITFLGLHGGFGEDGRLQAAFDVLGIQYTGPSSIGNVLAMDKDITKKMFQMADIPTPQGARLHKNMQNTSLQQHGLSLPVVVKPCTGGSSIGVYIAHTQEEYQDALEKSFALDVEVIVESYIKGREFSCGILGEQVLPIIEIIPKSGFFDYAHKYQSGFSQEICPADLPAHLTKKIQETTRKAFDALKLDVYSRADCLVDENENIYFLEMNTLPGMTSSSLFPQEAAAAGIEYTDLCERIIEESLKARPPLCKKKGEPV